MGSVRGESQVLTCNPNLPIQQSFLAALKINQKKRNSKHSSGAQRREQSQGNLCECSLPLFLRKGEEKKETRKKVLEKLVLRKAGTGGKKRKILQENKLGSVPVH